MTRLAELTTLGVGGPARRLLEPATRDELVAAARAMWREPDDWLLLGGGSNLLVADEGVDGTVLRVATRGIGRADAPPGTVRIVVEAGEPWDDVVAHAVGNGWSGIEALSGIPGSAGAAPVQNLGAYGQELAETLAWIDFLEYPGGELVRVPAVELGFGYRTSALKQGRLGLVVAIALDLADDPEGRPVAYSELADALGVRLGDRVPAADVRAAVLRLRAAKGMLLDPADPDSRSAGSFFTNPIVTESFARALPADAPRWPVTPEPEPRVLPLGSDVPPAPVPSRYLVKLSAAWLIERAGIHRGFALPGSRAAISSKHTLAIVNRGGATATEIVQLATFVQTRVLAEFGVRLQPEPTLVGVEL